MSITPEDIDNTLKKSKLEVLENTRGNYHKQFVNDTISELSWWAAFRDNTYGNNSIEEKTQNKSINKKKLKESC